ncbi:MAG: hypothetical protein ACJ8GJ_01575 [Vitreoscilla sp.]
MSTARQGDAFEGCDALTGKQFQLFKVSQMTKLLAALIVSTFAVGAFAADAASAPASAPVAKKMKAEKKASKKAAAASAAASK